MNFDAPASTWMPSSHQRPAVTLTFILVVTVSVWTNERTNVADGRPENIMPSMKPSDGEVMKMVKFPVILNHFTLADKIPLAPTLS